MKNRISKFQNMECFISSNVTTKTKEAKKIVAPVRRLKSSPLVEPFQISINQIKIPSIPQNKNKHQQQHTNHNTDKKIITDILT